MKKSRLDKYLIAQGLVEDLREAFVVVTGGRVFINTQKAVSPSQQVTSGDRIELRKGREFVGRGAYKLEGALVHFNIDVGGAVCADIGSATGGFTEVLLNHGAKKVYAIDTARGKLVPKLRSDPRVAVMEGVDVRDISVLPESIDYISIDVSLISLRNILPHAGRFLKKTGVVVALFKPQYEARDPRMLRHGVIRENEAREKLLSDFKEWCGENGWQVNGTVESSIRGSEGNVEYLLNLSRL